MQLGIHVSVFRTKKLLHEAKPSWTLVEYEKHTFALNYFRFFGAYRSKEKYMNTKIVKDKQGFMNISILYTKNKLPRESTIT